MKLLYLKRLSWSILGAGVAFFFVYPVYFHGWQQHWPAISVGDLLAVGLSVLPYLLAGGAVALARRSFPAYVALFGCCALVVYGAVTECQLLRDDLLYSEGDSTQTGIGFLCLWGAQMLGCAVLLYFMGGAWLVSWSLLRRQKPDTALQVTAGGSLPSPALHG